MSSTSETPPLSREERFKALRSKLSSSQSANRQAVIAEHKRQRLDPALLSKLDRKKAEAEMKLAKADAEDAQEDFERKRAWDWTIEESEKWDLRMQEKQGNRESANFADYTQASEKNYRKNMKGFKPDLDGYRKAKEEALERGELVRREDGEVVAVGGEGAFYATRNSLGLVDHKPSKDAVDRLVEETKKREAEKEANRRKKRAGEDGDINYINKRNKVFNQKLARFYDPYTRETREAFERGSAA